MQLRTVSVLVLTAGFLTSCTGTEDTSTPGGPSSSSPSSSNTPSGTPSSPGANRPPGRVTLDFQPKSPILAGATAVSLSATVTDPDGDSLTYSWDMPDEVLTAGGGISYTFNRGGNQRVKVTVSDGKGGTSTAEMNLDVRTLEGEWTLVNPAHQAFTTNIRHNGRSISGSFSSGKHSFTGNVNDGNRVFIRLDDGGDFYCLSSGNYSGNIDASLNVMEFPGVSCKGFALHRR